MINRKKIYMNITFFSIIIAIIIAFFSVANKGISLYTTQVTFVSGITFTLSIIQVSILIYNTLKELRDLSYRFFITFKVSVPEYSPKSIKKQFLDIYIAIVSHIKLQVIRC